MTNHCPVPHNPRPADTTPPELRIEHRSGLWASLDFMRNTFGMLESIPRTADIVVTRILGTPTVILAHPSPVAEMLRDAKGIWIKDRMSQRATDVFGNGLLLSEGNTWKRQRRMLNPGFSAGRFDDYAQTMRHRTAAAIARWPARGVIDAAAEMSRLTLDVAVRTLFGADISDDDVYRVSTAFSAVSDYYASPLAMLPFDVPRWLPLPLVRRHVRAVSELDAVVHELIGNRRASNQSGDDLLSMMLALHDEDGGLSDREVRDQAVTFLLAGHETTALALTFAIFELGRNDTYRERLRAEVDAAPSGAGADAYPLATQVIQESLRLYPPAYALSRENVRDTTLGGVPIAKGTMVIAAPWTLHRDARWHREPLVFHPERWTPTYEQLLPIGSYLPFGLGARKCIGTRFAMIEAVLLLAGVAHSHDWSSVDAALPPLQPAITCKPTRPVRIEIRRHGHLSRGGQE